jgi:hypothetical protein
MQIPTITLNTRFDSGIEAPSIADLDQATAEIFDENNPNCSAADYAEHPNAWLTYGFADADRWTVITLDLYRSGVMRFVKYADQDDDDPEFEMVQQVNRQEALTLWSLLRDGKLQTLAERPWQSSVRPE